MSTSNLSQTTPHVAAPSFPPLLGWASGALQRAEAFLIRTFRPAGSDYSAFLSALPILPSTPLLFSGKGIYTPRQEWNGYR